MSEGATFELPDWGTYLLAAGLVSMSGLFSGLTLGLLSLDKASLEILAEAGDDAEKKHARQIIPLRRDGNLLLCTLLIGNVIVNSLLSILLAEVSSGLTGLFASSALIVVLGEIIPQAACSRHGLRVGAKTRYLTWFFIITLFIVAKPIAFVLDLVLGKEVGGYYSKDELKQLIKMQVKDHKDKDADSGIFQDDHVLLVGALNYGNRTVADVMTKADNVFMLDMSKKLNFETMLEIYKTGLTRIPVYEHSREFIKGILYVKDLILVDPDDEITLEAIVTFRNRGGAEDQRPNFLVISDLTPLNEVLSIFKHSYSHLMIAASFTEAATGEVLRPEDMAAWASDDPNAPRPPPFTSTFTGVITLEDVIEEVIDHEIVDEHDQYKSNRDFAPNDKGARRDIAQFLSLFEHKVREHSKVTRHEVNAITGYLATRVKPFFVFEGAESQLRQLVGVSTIFDADAELASSHSSTTAESADVLYLVDDPAVEPGGKVEGETVLYKRGMATDVFTLVLQGHVNVWAGEDAFHSEIGPWTTLGERALAEAGGYRPDFTAVTNGACRVLQMTREAYTAAAGAVNAAKAARGGEGMPKRASRRRLNGTGNGAAPQPSGHNTPDRVLSYTNPTADPLTDVGKLALAAPSQRRTADARRTSSVMLRSTTAGSQNSIPLYAAAGAALTASDDGREQLISTQHAHGDVSDTHNEAWRASAPGLPEASPPLRGPPLAVAPEATATGSSSAEHTRTAIVMLDGSGKPVCIEEGEVRDLVTESPADSGELTRRRAGGAPASGMAIAMVRNAGATPVFRALTPSEALRTSSAGVDVYRNSGGAGGAGDA